MFIKEYIKRHQEVFLLCLLSLIIRLIVMPYAQSTDADATSRVFIADELLHNFRLLTSGVWAPFHHYFNAFMLWIIPSREYAPKILHILFAVFSCIPLYYFTRNEFNKKGALFVTLIYSFCPVVFKNSFLAMAEVCYGFFVLMSLYFISKGRLSEQKIKYGMLAGIMITIAGGVRYEAWALMPVLFFVIMLLKEWKILIPFTITAAIFPVSWMLGNYFEYKDFLYSVNAAYHWNIELSGVNDHLSSVDKIVRLCYSPMSWILMLTPLVTVVLIVGVVMTIRAKTFKKNHLIWLLPFVFMLATFMYKTLCGTLLMQQRFSITLVIFSVPFFALFFDSNKFLKIKQIISITVITLMIPLSFYWHLLPLSNLVKFSDTLSAVVNNNITDSEEAIPYIKNNSTEAFLETINTLIQKDDGLFLDFIGWEDTYYIALNSHVEPRNIFIGSGAIHSKQESQDYVNFFNQHPHGYITIEAFGRFDNSCRSTGSLLKIDDVPLHIYLEKVLDLDNIKLFRYVIKDQEWVNIYMQKHQNDAGITQSKKNIYYYERAIKNSNSWLKDIEQKAHERNLSTAEMIRIDAQWMVDQDSNKSQNDSVK